MREDEEFDLLAHVDDGFKMYAECEGVDLESKGGRLDHAYDEIRAFSESQWARDNGLTSFMVLRVLARLSGERCSISARDLHEGWDNALDKTSLQRSLLTHVDVPEAMRRVTDFQLRLREAAALMGLGDMVKRGINDLEALAFVRRDALVSHRYLSVHTFNGGDGAGETVQFNRNILKFWNVDSVLVWARLQPESAVSLCLVRDPVGMWSYFAFVIRDGERITIWTDVPDQAHPLQKFMTRARGNERRFHDRMFKLRFPYQLLDFEFDEDGRFIRENSESLVPINATAVRICGIEDVEPDQALWLMMMFTLIRDDPRHELKLLSATGSGLVALPEMKWSDGKALVHLPGTADLPLLAHPDMILGALVTAGAWEDRGTEQNQWMEDRYASRVPSEMFNLVSNIDRTEGCKRPGITKTLDGRCYEPAFPDVKIERRGHYRGYRLDFAAMDPSVFGTPEKLERDRRWIARYNQAKYILALAWEEFHDSSEKVLDWWHDALLANRDNLLESVARGTLLGEAVPIDGPSGTFVHGEAFEGKMPNPGQLDADPDGWEFTGDLVRGQYFSKQDGPPGDGWSSSGKYYSGVTFDYLLNKRSEKFFDQSHVGFYDSREYERPHFRCAVTDQAARVWTYLRPSTAVGIARLAGVGLQDLPDVLQFWVAYEFYSGNSILNRLDPLDTSVDNPWKSYRFDITVALSLASFNKRRRSMGLAKHRPPTLGD